MVPADDVVPLDVNTSGRFWDSVTGLGIDNRLRTVLFESVICIKSELDCS